MRNFSSSSSRQRMRSSSNFARRHYARSSSTCSQKGSYQQATVNIDSQNLGLPYILSVNISGTQLTGQVRINNQVVEQLSSNNNQFNLSPYLSIGKNTIEILAQYFPSSSSSIGVELVGSDTRVTQQTSGSGVLRYTLTVVVR